MKVIKISVPTIAYKNYVLEYHNFSLTKEPSLGESIKKEYPYKGKHK